MSANSFFKQPGWDHVFAAFVAGAREARANPEADETVFGRAADAYTKLIFSEVDPETHRRIGENDWPDYATDASAASPRTDNTEPARARQESPKGCEAVQTRSHEVASKDVCDGEATDASAAPPPSAPCPHIRSSGVGDHATHWCALAEQRDGGPAMNIADMIEQAGGRVDDIGILPDGSGFATASFPLPADHWLTADDGKYEPPPMPLRMGDGPQRQNMAEKIRAAAQYAIRAATMKGRETDFDPDALVQNMVVGLLGYWTPDGLTGTDAWANPDPVPPLFAAPPPAAPQPEAQPVACTYPQCAGDAPSDGGCCRVPFTREMADAAERYVKSVGRHAHPLPAQFRWEECYRAMLAAAPTPPAEAATRTVVALKAERDALAAEQPQPEAQPVAPAYGIIDPDYARIFTQARVIAWQCGYALAMHGSFTRDLDLLAVPWTDAAIEAERLVARIADATGTRPNGHPPGEKPHGRRAWTLLLPVFGDPRFVDLSVMPRVMAAPEPSEAEVAAAMASLHRDMEPAAWPSEDEVTDALRAAAAARGE